MLVSEAAQCFPNHPQSMKKIWILLKKTNFSLYSDMSEQHETSFHITKIHLCTVHFSLWLKYIDLWQKCILYYESNWSLLFSPVSSRLFQVVLQTSCMSSSTSQLITDLQTTDSIFHCSTWKPIKNTHLKFHQQIFPASLVFSAYLMVPSWLL